MKYIILLLAGAALGVAIMAIVSKSSKQDDLIVAYTEGYWKGYTDAELEDLDDE